MGARFKPRATSWCLRAIIWSVLLAIFPSHAISPERVVAQVGGPVLMVYADPVFAQPGQWVKFDIIARGAGSGATITVDIPEELAISDEVRCVHSHWYCSPIDVGTNQIRVTADSLDSRFQMRVTLSFSVKLPQSAVPGTRYEVVTEVIGLYDILDPTLRRETQAVTSIEIMAPNGQRVPSPTPTVPVVPDNAPFDNSSVFRFEIRQGNILPLTYMVPADQTRFSVVQGYMNVAGSFDISVTLPAEIALTDEPTCSGIGSGSCQSVSVTQLPDGPSVIRADRSTSLNDTVRLEIEAQLKPSVPIGTSLSITGQYSVVDASGEQFEAEMVIRIHVAKPDRDLSPSAEVPLRVVIEHEGDISEGEGSCIELTQDGRWTPQYYVCDNDRGTADAVPQSWAILSDSSPSAGEIVVPVGVGSYYINAASLPDGFAVEPTYERRQVMVTPDGGEYRFELVSS